MIPYGKCHFVAVSWNTSIIGYTVRLPFLPFWCCLDAVSYVREVLVDITANVGQQNVDELLRQAEQMLTDIRRRDFSQNTHEVQEELARAIEGMYACLSVCPSVHHRL